MNVVSLFSGAGGMDLGFVKQGFNIIWANDFNEDACNTYSKNIGEHIVCGDITKIESSQIPDCDIVIGGSPCQGFSNANRLTNFLDNPKNFLAREFIRIVKDKKPKVFVLENVPQFATAGKGQFVNEFRDALSDYAIEVKTLVSTDYGVAQKRRRCIMIGSLVGLIKHPKHTCSTYKTVGEALRNLGSEIPNQNDIANSSEIVIERMKKVKQGENWKVIPEFEGKDKHSTLYKRLKLDEPSVTIANAAKILLTHPTEDRVLSIRECARIQSFPDDFVFYGGLRSKYQQIANAVPPLLGEAIARQIKEHMDTLNDQGSEFIKELIHT